MNFDQNLLEVAHLVARGSRDSRYEGKDSGGLDLRKRLD